MQSGMRLQAKLIRRFLRRLRQRLRCRRWSLQGVPVLFANSFPKSGTHLLTQVLQGFPHIGPAVDSGLPAIVTFEGDTGRQRAVREILADLQRLLSADIAYGHLHSEPELVAHLCQDGFASYLILRDPRDIVVSHVHYITDMQLCHIHHNYYKEVLHEFDERLTASILGRPNLEVPFPDIRQRFEPYLGWIEQPAVLMLRFEDFLTDQAAAVGQVFDHAVRRGFPSSVSRQASIEILIRHTDPRRSPTFRSGKSGAWREHFTDEHKRLFKDVTGNLLIRLGYEQDDDW